MVKTLQQLTNENVKFKIALEQILKAAEARPYFYGYDGDIAFITLDTAWAVKVALENNDYNN